MVEQTYALAKSGVYGLSGGVYQDSLETIIDDFGDGPNSADISEYSGDTSQFSVQTTTVYNGSNALQMDTGGALVGITSTTGLSNYPSQGDTYVFNQQLGSAGDLSYNVFAAQSESSTTPNGYNVTVEANNDQIRIWKDFTTTTLASASGTIPTGEWLEVEIDWASDGTITATVFDSTGSQIVQASATDTTYSSGGINWSLNNGSSNASTAYTDYARVI